MKFSTKTNFSYSFGYIKLFRNIQKWEFYKDISTKTLYIHLLLNATFDDYELTKYKITIPRGHYFTSVRNLSEETGLTVQQVRTSLSKLEKKEITITRVKNHTLIRINNWDIYQEKGIEQTKKIQIDYGLYFQMQYDFKQDNGREPNQIELKKMYSMCELEEVQKEEPNTVINSDEQESVIKKIFGRPS